MPLEQELKNPQAPESLVSGTTPPVITPTSTVPTQDVFSEDLMLIENTSVPFKYAEKPLKQNPTVSNFGVLNTINSVFNAMLVTPEVLPAGLDDASYKFARTRESNSKDGWDKIMAMDTEQRWNYASNEAKKIDDPFAQTILAAGSAVVDTATFTQYPYASESFSNSAAAKQTHDMLSTALPFARDLLVAYSGAGIPLAFGASSALQAHSQAEQIRNLTDNEYVHPMVAYTAGFATSFPFLRYMSAPLQMNVQKQIYNFLGKSFGIEAPKTAQIAGAMTASVAENYLANTAMGNMLIVAGASPDTVGQNSNVQLGSWAILGALMEMPQSPHAIGFKPAVDRIANRVSENIGGRPLTDQAFGMSVFDVSKTTQLDERVNGADIAKNTMDSLFKDGAAISEEGKLIIDTTVERTKEFAPGVIGEFKKSFDDAHGDVVKEGTPRLIASVKNQIDNPDHIVVGPEVQKAYERMIQRSNKQDVVGDASSTDDFATIVAHESVKALMNGDKPSSVLEGLGLKDTVALSHIDDLFNSTVTKWKAPTDEAFLAEAKQLDAELSGVYDGAGLFKKNGTIRNAWTSRFEGNISRGMKDLPPDQQKSILAKVEAFRQKWQVPMSERVIGTVTDNTDTAIDSFDLSSEITAILRQSNNGKIAKTMYSRINEFFADTGYALPDFVQRFGGDKYDGLLTDKEVNDYTRENFGVMQQIVKSGREYASDKNHNQNAFSAFLRSVVSGDIGRLDRVAQLSNADPIGRGIMMQATKSRRYAGIMESHREAYMKRATDSMMKQAKALMGTDSFEQTLDKTRTILDTINDAEIDAINTGKKLELVQVEGPSGLLFKVPAVVANKFPAGQIQFAQKFGNWNAKMYDALNFNDKSIVAINPRKIIAQATNFDDVPYDYGSSYYPRVPNAKAQDVLEEGKAYAEMLPHDRPFVNHTKARKAKSMLSTASPEGANFRDSAYDEFNHYYNNEWAYAMTNGQTDKYLDQYLTHTFGYAKLRRGDYDVYQPRKLWSHETGPESIRNVVKNEKTGEYETDNLALREILLYKKENEKSAFRIASSEFDTPSGRAIGATLDLAIGVPANLLSKLSIGGTRGLVYTLASALQGPQQSMSYMNTSYIKHPLSLASESIKGATKVNIGFLASRMKYGVGETIAKNPVIQKRLKAFENAKFDSPEFQDAIASLGYRKGQPEYNRAFNEYITENVPMFTHTNKWDISFGEAKQYSDKMWATAKKTGRASDYIKAAAETADKFTDPLVWIVSSDDAGSKSMSHGLGWDHFDRVMKQYAWIPKDAKSALQKKGDIYRELHGDLFSMSEFDEVMSYIKIGDINNAQKTYARLFAEVTTPSFTTANRSQVSKTLGQFGIIGKLVGRFSEWTFKAMPNWYQTVNEIRRGNYAPVATNLILAYAFYELYDEWNSQQGWRPKFARNEFGKDVMNTAGLRSFQDMVGNGIHMSKWIQNQFNVAANPVQKMSKPSFPLATGTFLGSFIDIVSNIYAAEEGYDPMKQNKAWSRIPGYKEYQQMLEGNYTANKEKEIIDFLDFIDGLADNKSIKKTAPKETPSSTTTKKEESMNYKEMLKAANLASRKELERIRNNKNKEK